MIHILMFKFFLHNVVTRNIAMCSQIVQSIFSQYNNMQRQC